MHTPKIDAVQVSAYEIPTVTPESDGTLEWNKTTLVLVELSAADQCGLGYSYADVATAKLIESLLAKLVQGQTALDIPRVHAAMVRGIRNLGRPGIASMAISAVDNALWDLKAKLLGTSILNLLGTVRDSAEVYGSGGFTSYSQDQLLEQLTGWAGQGFRQIKMKIGRDAAADIERVQAVRQAIGTEVEIFVDANGAYSRKQALAMAERFAESGVTWFEEPVSSDDLEGLRLLRDRAPAGMAIAAGEYGYDPGYFNRMLNAEAVDVLQADATRCGGITGFLEAGILAHAAHQPFSFHCAPAIHAAAACATPNFMVGEYFFDHARIESMLFDGTLTHKKGCFLHVGKNPALD